MALLTSCSFSETVRKSWYILLGQLARFSLFLVKKKKGDCSASLLRYKICRNHRGAYSCLIICPVTWSGRPSTENSKDSCDVPGTSQCQIQIKLGTEILPVKLTKDNQPTLHPKKTTDSTPKKKTDWRVHGIHHLPFSLVIVQECNGRTIYSVFNSVLQNCYNEGVICRDYVCVSWSHKNSVWNGP